MYHQRIKEEISTANRKEKNIVKTYIFVIKHVHMIAYLPIGFVIKLLQIIRKA